MLNAIIGIYCRSDAFDSISVEFVFISNDVEFKGKYMKPYTPNEKKKTEKKLKNDL